MTLRDQDWKTKVEHEAYMAEVRESIARRDSARRGAPMIGWMILGGLVLWSLLALLIASWVVGR